MEKVSTCIVSYNAIKEPTALKLHLGDAEKTYFMDEVFNPSASQEEVSVCYFSCQFRKEV